MTAMKDTEEASRLELKIQRTAELHAFASTRGVRFTDQEAAGVVAVTFCADVLWLEEQRRMARSQSNTLVRTPILPPSATDTVIGVAEVLSWDGRFLLLRRGDEVWMVPDRPNGWDHREPWYGNIHSVRWIGGPPAEAAFRRVGGPV